ncbi:MAG: hypothetical protein M0R06_20645 [Sphaerochaeta sp.]|nr:hypothetical protein [Sphaerochaeta sp.]
MVFIVYRPSDRTAFLAGSQEELAKLQSAGEIKVEDEIYASQEKRIVQAPPPIPPVSLSDPISV